MSRVAARVRAAALAGSRATLPHPSECRSQDAAVAEHLKRCFFEKREERTHGWADTRAGSAVHAEIMAEVEGLRAAGYGVGVQTFERIGRILARYGQSDAIRRVMAECERATGGGSGYLFLHAMAADLARADYDGVLAVYREFKESGLYAAANDQLRRLTRSAILRVFAARGDLAAARRAVRASERFEKVAACRETIHFVLQCCRTLEEARGVLRADFDARGFARCEATYAALLSACAGAAEADVVWEEMAAAGVAPERAAYTERAAAFRRGPEAAGGGGARRIEDLLRGMRRGGRGGEARPTSPSEKLYGHYVAAVEAVLDEAWRGAACEKEEDEEVVVVGEAWEDVWLRKALGALHQAQLEGVVRSPGLYVAVLRCYAACGRPTEAERLRELLVRELNYAETGSVTRAVQKAYDRARDGAASSPATASTEAGPPRKIVAPLVPASQATPQAISGRGGWLRR